MEGHSYLIPTALIMKGHPGDFGQRQNNCVAGQQDARFQTSLARKVYLSLIISFYLCHLVEGPHYVAVFCRLLKPVLGTVLIQGRGP